MHTCHNPAKPVERNTLIGSSRPTQVHRIALGSALVLLALGGIAHADSLVPVKQANQAQRGSTGIISLYSDVRARNVGDLLTITIAENTTATSTADTKVSQNDNANVFSGTGLVNSFFRSLALSATNSINGEGTGSTTRSGSLTTTLSVLVKEILPNGTLKIEGSRLVGINRETQKVTFTGIVRPEDITSSNSISSNLIAAVEVHYDGKGIVGDTQRPGVLSRIFHFLF